MPKITFSPDQHQDVSYCLYGSKRHMLMHVFTAPSMPFYNFGDLVLLEKIHTPEWVTFIYILQLSQLCWLRCSDTMVEHIIDESLESLVLQLSLLFQHLTETLSTSQIRFLEALLNNENRLNSKEVIDNYQLGNSANVAQIKKALIQKEIIDLMDIKTNILDPVYKLWLQRYYFHE